MAQSELNPTRVDGVVSNAAQSKGPPHPNLPTISLPNHDATNPVPEAPTSPSSARPRSRRGSFSFLRRSKSRSEIATTTIGPDGGRKLSRRKNKAAAKEEAAKKKVGIPPQLPSYHHLPQMNAPFVDGSSANQAPQTDPRATATATATTSTNATIRYSPSANTAEKPASRSGYNPNAFYQQRHLMADPSTTREGTPQTVAGSTPSPQPADPYARTESMTNRGRYSYANNPANGNVSSPRRMRRRKDPTPFNVLVVGSKGSGKTSFVEFLRHALLKPVRLPHASSSPAFKESAVKKEQGSLFTSHYLETDVDGERIGVTVYDSNGLEKHLIDLQLREFSYFLESKFQETFNEEQKVMRATGIRDTHIHCVFLVLDPSRLDHNVSLISQGNHKSSDTIGKPRIVGGLDQDLDVDLLNTLQGKTTVIPVISKADTVTTVHMAYLKRVVWDSLKKLKIDPLEALSLDSDSDADEPRSVAASALKQEREVSKGGDESKVDGYVSSVYDSAREGDEDDSETQSDTTVNNENGQLKPTAKADGASSAGKHLQPKHGEIRVSTMSENVDLPVLPFSIISPDMHDPSIIGRRFPWGFADPYNGEHCDFTRLLDSVFNEWRGDLREASRERWYEGWRTHRLKSRGVMYGQSPASMKAQPGAGRTVSGAVAYGGKGPESQMKSPSMNDASSAASRVVSASDIGVAVSDDLSNAPPVPSSASVPAPKSSYRGVGTY